MAAMYLPAKQRLSLEVTHRGGEAWWRSADGCGPMKAGAEGKGELTPCGIFLNGGLAPDGKFDGILSLGAVLTPSAPAAGIPSRQCETIFIRIAPYGTRFRISTAEIAPLAAHVCDTSPSPNSL